MKLNYKRTILVGLVFFSIQLFWAAYDFSIPLILGNTFALGNTMIGSLMALDNILALFLLPLFGLLSDKVSTKWGRRTPFIVVGTALVVVLATMLPLINDAQLNHPENYNLNLTLFIATLGLILVALGTYRSPAVALMPDVTVKPLRSKANAIINLLGALGTIVATLFTIILKKPGESFFPLYLAVVSTMAIAVTFFLFTIREKKLHEEMKQLSIEHHLDTAEDEQRELSGNRKMSQPEFSSLMYLLASIFFWFMGYNAVTSIFSLYATTHIGMTESQAATTTLIANLAGVVSFIPIGFLSQRIGRKKMIMGGIVALTGAFLLGSFVSAPGIAIYVLMVVAGMSLAAINVNSYPMVVEMSVGADIGKYTGYYYTASMTAQIITPIVSGFLIELLGGMGYGADGRFYAILFPYATLFVIISFFTMTRVFHGDAKKIDG